MLGGQQWTAGVMAPPSIVVVALRSSGKEFQTVGSCTANARRSTVKSRCRGTTISWCVADLRTSVTGVQQLTRYRGALPCWHLCMMTPSLYLTRSATSSQCRSSCKIWVKPWSNVLGSCSLRNNDDHPPAFLSGVWHSLPFLWSKLQQGQGQHALKSNLSQTKSPDKQILLCMVQTSSVTTVDTVWTPVIKVGG